MKQEVKELLVQYQQGELDGVLVYQALAKLSPNESMKKALLELVADEGRHAGILKKYTNKILEIQINQNNLLVSRQKFVTAFNMTFSSNTWSVTKQNLNMLKL